MKRTIAIFVLALGCATVSPANPPSGALEVDIRADKKIVMDQFATMYPAAGFRILAVSDRSLIVEKPASSDSRSPSLRLTLNFTDRAELVHVRAYLQIVAYPGNRLETMGDLSSIPSSVQKDLESMKAMLEGGVIGVSFTPDLAINLVIPGSPAESAGLHPGDRLLMIDQHSVTTPEAATALLRGEPGSKVTLQVFRDGAAREFVVERKGWDEVYPRRK